MQNKYNNSFNANILAKKTQQMYFPYGSILRKLGIFDERADIVSHNVRSAYVFYIYYIFIVAEPMNDYHILMDCGKK